MKLFAGLWVFFFVVVMLAVPCKAAPLDCPSPACDQRFLEVMHEAGIGFKGTTEQFLAAGRAVCEAIDMSLKTANAPGPVILNAIADEIARQSGLSPDDAAYVEGASIAAFCPWYVPMVDGGIIKKHLI